MPENGVRKYIVRLPADVIDTRTTGLARNRISSRLNSRWLIETPSRRASPHARIQGSSANFLGRRAKPGKPDYSKLQSCVRERREGNFRPGRSRLPAACAVARIAP
jgi:hypothetical protein